ncbi:MAG: hypothetical protein ACI3V2_10475 [Faecousia sp.]
MKRLFPILLLLVILLLVGCKTQNPPPAAQEGTASSSEPRAPSEGAATQNSDAAEQTAPNSENSNEPPEGSTNDSSSGASGTSGSQGVQPTYPAPTGEPWVSDVPTEQNDPVELEGLRFTSFGRYSGAYVEDGSDDPVEDVAIVLVVNTSERFLEYAAVSFEIDGEPATFTVTNLPPQRGAWVLARDALKINSGASFVLKGGTTTFCTPEASAEIQALPMNGTVLVENHSETAAFTGYIYYKNVYEDGNYLGGITYRSQIEDLPPQSSTEITAAHCSETTEIVRITPVA